MAFVAHYEDLPYEEDFEGEVNSPDNTTDAYYDGENIGHMYRYDPAHSPFSNDEVFLINDSPSTVGHEEYVHADDDSFVEVYASFRSNAENDTRAFGPMAPALCADFNAFSQALGSSFKSPDDSENGHFSSFSFF